MFIEEVNTIIILPHIDDEFALLPLLKEISNFKKKYLQIIYCAEKLNKFNKINRRKENYFALELCGLKNLKPIFLNDYFVIEASFLYKSAKDIYIYLEDLQNKFKFEQILTLSFEGGHPDHDALALIVNKFSYTYKLKTFYFPAYNPRRDFLLPLTVCKPLKSQESFFKYKIYNKFCWFDLFRIVLIYKSEISAFIKLLPFFITKVFFCRKLYYTNIIDVDSVVWSKSFSWNIYHVRKKDIIYYLNKI